MLERIKCLLFGHIDAHPDKVFMEWEPNENLKYELRICKRCHAVLVELTIRNGYHYEG